MQQQPQQSQESATTSTAPRPQGATGPAVQRQFVNFAFFRLDPAFRRLTPQQQDQAREEFVSLFAAPRNGLICLTYSTVGLKADCDFLIWRISLSPDDFQSQQSASRRYFFLPTLRPLLHIETTKFLLRHVQPIPAEDNIV